MGVMLDRRFERSRNSVRVCASAGSKTQGGSWADCAPALTTRAVPSAILPAIRSHQEPPMTKGRPWEEGESMAEILLGVGDRENGARSIRRRSAAPTHGGPEMIERRRGARDLLASK